MVICYGNRPRQRRRQRHPTPVLSPGKSRGRRSLVGCSPWGREESTRLSDFTFTLHFHALEKEMATHSCVLAWRIPGTGSLVGCRLWGHTESDMTERLSSSSSRLSQSHSHSAEWLEQTCDQITGETRSSEGDHTSSKTRSHRQGTFGPGRLTLFQKARETRGLSS